ncbi:MAG: MmgE/PrpD family protein [SAR324 cluster bacterium]|nr:MmgE/PrpD family protein [SAR324 cluster bacterium]
MESISRQLAQWVVGLSYDDLPTAVVDRAKGVTLHSLASVLLGSQTREGQQAVQLMTAEESGVAQGATIMVDGTKVTKGGAAFANAEMAMSGGKLDSFRMLTHPGTSILPGAFVAAETAAFQTPGVMIGLFCSTPMVPLSRAIPTKKAMEMLLTGRPIDAHEAERLGLVNRVVPAERLADETLALAAEIIAYSAETIAMGKQAFYRQLPLPIEAAYDVARETMTANAMTGDAQEGMSAFLEKRPPIFKH